MAKYKVTLSDINYYVFEFDTDDEDRVDVQAAEHFFTQSTEWRAQHIDNGSVEVEYVEVQGS